MEMKLLLTDRIYDSIYSGGNEFIVLKQELQKAADMRSAEYLHLLPSSTGDNVYKAPEPYDQEILDYLAVAHQLHKNPLLHRLEISVDSPTPATIQAFIAGLRGFQMNSVMTLYWHSDVLQDRFPADSLYYHLWSNHLDAFLESVLGEKDHHFVGVTCYKSWEFKVWFDPIRPDCLRISGTGRERKFFNLVSGINCPAERMNLKVAQSKGNFWK